MTSYKYKINGKEYEVTINSVSETNAQVTVNGASYEVEMIQEEKPQDPIYKRPSIPAREAAPHAEADKSLKSPLPGMILAIKVKVGDTVREGQPVAVLEAMKMENEILSEHDGTVTEIHVEKGETVLEGATIVTIK
jgi:biotin carboxyl carrier protein